MTDSVAQWKKWTEMPFPASGEYVISDRLSTLHVEKAADMGIHVEPNIWVQHR